MVACWFSAARRTCRFKALFKTALRSMTFRVHSAICATCCLVFWESHSLRPSPPPVLLTHTCSVWQEHHGSMPSGSYHPTNERTISLKAPDPSTSQLLSVCPSRCFKAHPLRRAWFGIVLTHGPKNCSCARICRWSEN